MFAKINLSRIIKNHFQTFRDSNSGKYLATDFVVFLGIPLLLSIISQIIGFSLKESMISLMVTSISIFAALLFNLLLLIYDIVRKSDDSPSNSKKKKEFLIEIYSNISFCILVSIISVVFLVVATFPVKSIFLDQSIDSVVVFLVSLFILTLLMILKRVHILLAKEF